MYLVILMHPDYITTCMSLAYDKHMHSIKENTVEYNEKH